MPLLLLFLVFIVLPLAELYVIIKVGEAIGIWPTLALLLLDGFVGAALSRSQGRLAWQRFNAAMGEGRVPAREVFDGAMIMFGGALLLSPGFLTDVVGIGLLLPPTRAMMRSLVRRAASKTPAGRPVFFAYERFGRPPSGGRGEGGSRSEGGSSSGPAERRGESGYDVEGSAREIPDSDSSLPPGGER